MARLRSDAEARGDLAQLARFGSGHLGPGAVTCEMRCPAHDDRHASLTASLGKDHDLIWYDHRKDKDGREAGCDPGTIREKFIELGVPERLLGTYCRNVGGTRISRVNGRDPGWREVEQLRAENNRLRGELVTSRARLAAVVAALDDPSAGSKITALRLLVLVAAEGREIPATRKELRELCLRAGARPTQIKDLVNLYLPTTSSG